MTCYDSGCLYYWSKRLLMLLKRKPIRICMIPHAQFAAIGLQIDKPAKVLPGIHAQTWVRLPDLFGAAEPICLASVSPLPSV